VSSVGPAQTCLVCGEAIAAGAKKCVKCGAFQNGSHCVSCGLPIPPGAVRCKECKAYQKGRTCESCGASLPADARRCSECKKIQGWLSFAPQSEMALALILSIISVLSAVLPALYKAWNHRSRSYIRILGPAADGKSLLIAVGNDGSRPAVVQSLAMEFDGIRLENVPAMEILNREAQLILPEKSVVLQITVFDLVAKKGVSIENVPDDLDKGRITVKARIIETSITGEHYVHPDDDDVSDKAPGIYIKEMLVHAK
jgi:predicted nucleic acid-binding Zn ribbon protein